MVTGKQIRAARALLGMSQVELGRAAGLSETGVVNIETGRADPKVSTLANIIRVLEGRGIEFLGDDGVKLRKGAEPDSLR
jgi:DNA-binding XRE family transcriptional regulator